ncbi:hypothetical protein E6Q11_01825 [Candidatus Dojkabacteria bacterium]|uniref:Uncharacterized protein n=1 Tax=Candidatus Dojkabacteria bacterium TaxID=2099670 RepID=A0A5C7J994_9BACT|nr:MAG: hypothetical protein E6Q11_01825 [Candidatus Dojkabacteria bacterium]
MTTNNIFIAFSPPPTSQRVVDNEKEITREWRNWVDSLYNEVNTLANASSQQSLLLNSDFNFSDGISLPVTETEPDGAFIAEKWQIMKSTGSIYSCGAVDYIDNDQDNSGSRKYLYLNVSDVGEAGISVYQEMEGHHNIRRFQKRNVTFTVTASNSSLESCIVNLEISILDGSTIIYNKKSSSFTWVNGKNSHYAVLKNQFSISSFDTLINPKIQFKLNIIKVPLAGCLLRIHHIKLENGIRPTPLIVDHPIERLRIDNS